MNKAYLIVFLHGKRYVEELIEFSGEYAANEFDDIVMGRKQHRTDFSGIGKAHRFFSLRGKKNGKKAWNKFIEGLKLK